LDVHVRVGITATLVALSPGSDNTGTPGPGGGAIEYDIEAVIVPAALVAVTTIVPEATAEGVPDIAPVDALIDNPAGKPVAEYVEVLPLIDATLSAVIGTFAVALIEELT
jgi:hypothetical protein